MSLGEILDKLFKNITVKNIAAVAKSILLKSIKSELWVLHLAILILDIIFLAIILGVPFLITIIAIFLWAAILQNKLIILILAAFWFLCFLLLIIAYSALEGIKINAVNDFIQKGKFTFSDAWEKTKPRLLTITGINILSLLVLLLIFCSFLLFIIPIFIAGDSPATALLVGIGFFVWMGLIMLGSLFSIFLAPFLMILKPVVILETSSVIGSIKRTIFLGKRNYIYNFIFCLLYTAFTYIISFIYQLIMFFPIVILMFIPLIGVLLIFILMLPVTIYSLVLDSLLRVRIYLEDLKRVEASKV